MEPSLMPSITSCGSMPKQREIKAIKKTLDNWPNNLDLNKLSVQSIRQEIVIMNNFSGANYFIIFTHCSKSSFFVQKFNFDFPRKLSIFWGEKLVKMLWFWTF